MVSPAAPYPVDVVDLVRLMLATEYVKVPSTVEVPPTGTVTETETAPREPAGVVAVIEVSELTVKLVAGLAPKSTAVAPVKPVPVIVTTVPPGAGPFVGLIEVTVGAAI